MKRIIICLVGESGAGKGTIAFSLKEIGYTVLSLSSEVRDLAKEKGLKNASRTELQILANNARKSGGANFFAQRLISNPSFAKANHLVIDGIRHPSEIKIIRSQATSSTKVIILAVTASVKTRYQRILKRQDPSDPLSFEQFLKNDLREKGSRKSKFSQQNKACIKMADVEIKNEGNLQELKTKLIKFLPVYGRYAPKKLSK